MPEFQFRTFQNSDPPHLATIWRSLPPQRGRVQPMTAALLEQCVFSKQHFDPNGFIVATQEGKPVGFAHAGFGPNDKGDSLENQIGVTYCVLHQNDLPAQEAERLDDALLQQSEAYLFSHGAKVLYGGGIHPLSGFYLGLYGGSELPGILDSDADQQAIFHRNDYKTIDRVVVLQKELATFKPTVSRQQRECNRRCEIVALPDPSTETWWEACTEGCFDRMAYQLTVKGTDKPAAVARFWYMEPMATSWGQKVAGLDMLEVNDDCRCKGYATCLLGSALQDLKEQGVTLVEAQTMQHNEAALALYAKLGFNKVDYGAIFRKNG